MSSHHNNDFKIWLYFIVIIPPLMGAGNFTVARGMFEQVPPLAMAFWRWFVAWLFIIPLIWNRFHKDWPLIKENLGIIFWISLPGIVLFNTIIYFAAHYTQSINLSLIVNAFPIFVIIFSAIFLNEKINIYKFIGIILALIGTVSIVTKGQFLNFEGFFNNIGDFLAILGSIVWGVYGILLKKRPTKINLWSFMFVNITIGWVMLLPFYLIEHVYFAQMQVNMFTSLGIFYLAVPVSIIGLYCWNYSVSALGATTSSMFFYLAPVFNSILSVTILGEVFGWYHLLGMALILLGINLPFLSKIRLFKKKVKKKYS
jgi:drug/metabolite transporter (DMT)-like permease